MHPEINAACARLHLADLARDAAERRRRPARRQRLRVPPGKGLPS
jgi:hypothetical protein